MTFFPLALTPKNCIRPSLALHLHVHWTPYTNGFVSIKIQSIVEPTNSIHHTVCAIENCCLLFRALLFVSCRVHRMYDDVYAGRTSGHFCFSFVRCLLHWCIHISHMVLLLVVASFFIFFLRIFFWTICCRSHTTTYANILAMGAEHTYAMQYR